MTCSYYHHYGIRKFVDEGLSCFP